MCWNEHGHLFDFEHAAGQKWLLDGITVILDLDAGFLVWTSTHNR
jgi:hypothetical protein